MTQPQKYAVVPVDASRRMIDSAERVDEDGYDAMLKAMIEAAPPPPEQVLSAVEAHDLGKQLIGGIDPHETVRAIERAVLKQLGAKNV